MDELLGYRQNLLNRLDSIVGELRAAASALPPEAWNQPLNGQTRHWWLAHLRAIEDQALSMRLRRIRDEYCPYLQLFDDGAWMAAYYDPHEPPESLLAGYARLREEELEWLQVMAPSIWNRTARHPWFGVRTLQWWGERCLSYAREHLGYLQNGSVG
jgi:hypothetical protein